jgi:hypothetical protein
VNGNALKRFTRTLIATAAATFLAGAATLLLVSTRRTEPRHPASGRLIDAKSIAVTANAESMNDERDEKKDDVKTAAREASQRDDTIV